MKSVIIFIANNVANHKITVRDCTAYLGLFVWWDSGTWVGLVGSVSRSSLAFEEAAQQGRASLPFGVGHT